jgi:putative transposase
MQRQPLKASNHIGQVWSMDFVADNLFDGRKLRRLTVVDCHTRQCVAIEVGQSLKGNDVVRVLEQAIRQYLKPITIKSDNGSEFVGKVMDKWLYENKIKQDLSRPSKPTDNAYIESFNGRLRQECLNEHWFMSLGYAKAKIEAWRNAYNTSRPHSALD